MGQSWLKSLIVPCLVLIVVVDGLQVLPDSVNLITRCTLIAVSVLSAGAIVMYYASLPSQKKTILVHLMQMYMVLNSIILIHGLIISVLKYERNTMQAMLDYAPNLTCSIMMEECNIVIFCNCCFAFLLFKTLASVASTEYLSMNHDKTWKITCFTITISMIIEYTFLMIYYGTWCTLRNIHYIETFTVYTFDKSQLKYKPETLVIHEILMFLPELIKFMNNLWRKLSSKWYCKFRYCQFDFLHNIMGRTLKEKNPSSLKYVTKRRLTNESDQIEDFNNIELGKIKFSGNYSKTKPKNQVDSLKTVMVKPYMEFQPGSKTLSIDIPVVKVGIAEKPRVSIRSSSQTVDEKPIKCSDINFDDIEVLEDEIVVCSQVKTYQSTSIKSISKSDKKENIDDKEKNLPCVKLNNFIPRIDMEEVKILAEDSSGPSKTPKPQLLKTDTAIWICAIILILAIVIIVKLNSNVVLTHHIIAKIYFIVMPTYWIVKSEEKMNFVQRRFNRFMYRYRL